MMSASANARSEQDSERCIICQDGLDHPFPLSCGHRFHAECLVPWFRAGHRACPTCRDTGGAASEDDTLTGEASDEDLSDSFGSEGTGSSEESPAADSDRVLEVTHVERIMRRSVGLKTCVSNIKRLRTAVKDAELAVRRHATRGKGTFSQLRRERARLIQKRSKALARVARAELDLLARSSFHGV